MAKEMLISGFMQARRFSVWLAFAVAIWAGLPGTTVRTSSAGPDNVTPAAVPQKVRTVRVAAIQVKKRIVDWHVAEPAQVLAAVDQTLADLERVADTAAAKRCDVIAFPEDTLGLGSWEAANPEHLAEVLLEGVMHMLNRLGRTAAKHRMYVVCCNDTYGTDRQVRNTAFFLGRDGNEIGHYDKVNMPVHELYKQRGTNFPVFATPDLGGVGLLICYDMVFPEAARCLALGGADIIFHPTLGGAAIGDDDISRAAFRTRAVENFVYLVVAQRGGGSMILSPQGKIIAEGKSPDDIVIADIDPFAGREGGDAMNYQIDMRARIFRERSPAAFGILTAANPPVLAKVPETLSVTDAVTISALALTQGEAEFGAASRLLRAGETNAAIAAFTRLRQVYRATWIDRVSTEQLSKLGVKPMPGQ